MVDNGYEAYKRDFIRDQRAHNNFRRGKYLLVIGVCLLLYVLYILPFDAGNASEIRGDEMKAGDTYGRAQVYYMEGLQLLCAKAGADDGEVYGIAQFTDCEGNDWIVSFTPGKDKELSKRIRDGIRLSESFDGNTYLPVSGYFQIQSMEALPYEADSFYSVYGSRYVNADGSNMLKMNADYLCKRTDSYTLALLSRAGIPFGSLVAGLVGVIYGSILLVKNRSWKTA